MQEKKERKKTRPRRCRRKAPESNNTPLPPTPNLVVNGGRFYRSSTSSLPNGVVAKSQSQAKASPGRRSLLGGCNQKDLASLEILLSSSVAVAVVVLLFPGYRFLLRLEGERERGKGLRGSSSLQGLGVRRWLFIGGVLSAAARGGYQGFQRADEIVWAEAIPSSEHSFIAFLIGAFISEACTRTSCRSLLRGAASTCLPTLASARDRIMHHGLRLQLISMANRLRARHSVPPCGRQSTRQLRWRSMNCQRGGLHHHLLQKSWMKLGSTRTFYKKLLIGPV